MENQRIVADTLSGKGESMADMEKLLVRIGNERDAISRKEEQTGLDYMIDGVLMNCSVMLKEQDERLRKLQKDKDNLCLEISEWKHKFHDAPPKFVSQGVVDQIRWERDTALSQLEQIGKGLGSKMDDIVALLDKQDSEKKRILKIVWDTLHEGLSIDTVSDQDWVYERIRNRIEGTYPEV